MHSLLHAQLGSGAVPASFMFGCGTTHSRYTKLPSQATPDHSQTGAVSFQPDSWLTAANSSQFSIASRCSNRWSVAVASHGKQ